MSQTPVTTDPDGTLCLLPAQGAPVPLLVLLHGYGSQAEDLLPLAQRLHGQFPQSAVLIPQGFEPAAGTAFGRQWFSLTGVTEADRPARVAAAMPAFLAWVRAAQARLGVDPAATALVGFSQGAIMSLEAAQEVDGLAGRVLAFAGRYARLPERAPTLTTLHLFHGTADEVIPVAHAHQAIERLNALQGDVTVDLAEGVGHQLHPALVDQALFRLTSHIPQRTWRAALGAAQEAARAAAARGDADADH